MISPLAYIDASAKLGKNVKVHPFAYIDKNVEIGDDCEIMPYASIMNGARLGKRNRVFNGAVIAAEPQDFNYKGDETIVEIGNDNVIRENVVKSCAENAQRNGEKSDIQKIVQKKLLFFCSEVDVGYGNDHAKADYNAVPFNS